MAIEDLWRQLDERNAAPPEQRVEIDASIWERFGRERTVVVTDMTGFSKTTRDHGILHFMGLIRRTSRLARPIVEALGGRIVKGVADNLFLSFDDPQAAVDAALSLQGAVHEDGTNRPDSERIRLAIGIASGRIIDVDGTDFYGNPVNLASKLGEDIGGADDILITSEAMSHVQLPDGFTTEARRARISEVDLDYVAIMAPQNPAEA